MLMSEDWRNSVEIIASPLFVVSQCTRPIDGRVDRWNFDRQNRTFALALFRVLEDSLFLSVMKSVQCFYTYAQCL